MAETVERGGKWGVEDLAKFCVHAEPEDRGRGNTLYRGFLMLLDGYWLDTRLEDDFAFYESWSKPPYLMVWVHRDMKAIATYCEGDITLSTHIPRSDAYFEEYRAACAFYQENR